MGQHLSQEVEPVNLTLMALLDSSEIYQRFEHAKELTFSSVQISTSGSDHRSVFVANILKSLDAPKKEKTPRQLNDKHKSAPGIIELYIERWSLDMLLPTVSHILL